MPARPQRRRLRCRQLSDLPKAHRRRGRIGNADATVEAVKGGEMHDHSNGKFQIRRLTIPPRYLSCASTPAQTNNNAM